MTARKKRFERYVTKFLYILLKCLVTRHIWLKRSLSKLCEENEKSVLEIKGTPAPLPPIDNIL